MPPKRGKEIPKHGRQLNIKCSPEFFELAEMVHQTERMGLAECVRMLFLDRSLRYITLAIRLGALVLGDVERINGDCANGERSGLDESCTKLLAAIGMNDPTFSRRYGLLMAQDLIGGKAPQLLMGDILTSFRKHHYPLEVLV